MCDGIKFFIFKFSPNNEAIIRVYVDLFYSCWNSSKQQFKRPDNSNMSAIAKPSLKSSEMESSSQ